MGKMTKVRQARIHAQWVMARCKIGNPTAMAVVKTDLDEDQKKAMTSAIANAIQGFGKGLKQAKGDTTNVTSMGKLDNEGWLRIGHNSIMRMKQGEKVSLVCDTCAATMAAMLSTDPVFSGSKVEMIRCGFNTHHFLAVDRQDGDINVFGTWGIKAFVIDIWDDSLSPSREEGMLYGVFEKPSLSSLVADAAFDHELAVTQTFRF